MRGTLLRTCIRCGSFLTLLTSLARAQETTYRVYVTNERSGDVTVIDPAANSVVATIAVGTRPRGIRASSDGSKIYIALSGTPISGPPDKREEQASETRYADRSADGIAVINCATNKVIDKLQAGIDPENLALLPDDSLLFVSNEDVSSASIIDLRSRNIVKKIDVGEEPEGVATDGKRVYITCETTNNVYVIDAATHQVLTKFETAQRPRAAAFLPDDSKAYITCESGGAICVVDVTTSRVIKTIKPPGTNVRPMGMAISADGNRVFVSTGRGGSIVVIDPAKDEVVGKVANVGARPWGLALSPDGSRLFSANGPSNDVSVIDTDAMKVIGKIKAGSSPWGVAVAATASERK
jgi:YVTN family beta-propeller protein